MIDTHAHIYLEQFAEDRAEMILKCKQAGVDKVYLPNIDVNSIAQVKDLATEYPDYCLPMMGLHPCSVKEDYKEQLAILKQELENGTYVAVGEIGIDLYWDKSTHKEQEEAYRMQIEWAREHNLPFVIHSRDSLDETIEVVKDLQNGDLSGIFHCFNGTVEQGKRIIDLGFYLGIGGVVTFKNAGVDKVVSELPIEWMVLETDAPYLSPVPYRGKRNEPSYLSYVAEKIAMVKNIPLKEVDEITTANALKVYNYLA